MPWQWWPDAEAVRTVVEGQGPWPSRSPQYNGTFTSLDVDQYQRLAITVGCGTTRLKSKVALGVDEFHQDEAGQWRHLGGSASGFPLDPLEQRQALQNARQELHIRVSGNTGTALFEERPQFAHAVFLCGPEVAIVEIDRRHGIRTADLSIGPGWLAVL
jgi:hypothetical protein